MKLTCPRSGVRYSVSNGFASGSAIHPVFQLPTISLLQNQLPAYLAGVMNTTDVHLFGSALLASLPIERWECKLASPSQVESIWAAQIERMAAVIGRLDGRTFDRIPKFAITKQTRYLRTLPGFLEEVEKILKEGRFTPDSERKQYSHSQVTELLFKILRSTKETMIRRKRLPMLMSQWAVTAGNFPTDVITIQTLPAPILMPVWKYWQGIIREVFKEKDKMNIITSDVINLGDLVELTEHCEAELPFGHIHTDALLKELRASIEIIEEFRTAQKRPVILAASSTITVSDIGGSENEAASLRHLASPELAPLLKAGIPQKKPPERKDFDSAVAYIRARSAWSVSVITYVQNGKGNGHG